MFGFSVVVAASSCDLNLGLTETGVLASAPFIGKHTKVVIVVNDNTERLMIFEK